MSKIAIDPDVNPALMSEILTDEGYTALWFHSDERTLMITDAPISVCSSAAYLAHGGQS